MAIATVKTIIDKAYTKVNGEYESQVEGSDDWKTYLEVLNIIIENIVHMPYVKWQIYFDMNYTLGTVVDDTLSYTIANLNGIEIGNSPYDYVYFVDGGGVVVAKYKIVDVAMFQSTSNTQVATVAGNKLYLKATETLIVGTTIRIPAYVDPAPYTGASETVVVDSVSYVVAAMAAFICSSSPVPFIARNADRYEKEAALFMKQMKENNKRNQLLMVKSLNVQVGKTWADVMNVMTMKDL